MLSPAFAETLTGPDTDALSAGAVIATVGNVVSVISAETISTVLRLYRSPVGAVSLTVIFVPLADVEPSTRWTQ